MPAPPTVLVEKSLLTHPRDRALLDRFIDVAFGMAEQCGCPVAVQEIEGQLASFLHQPRFTPVWANEHAEYVTLLLPMALDAA